MAGGRLEKAEGKARRLYRSMESCNQRETVLLSRRMSQLNTDAISSLEKHLAKMELVGDHLKKCRMSSGWMPTSVLPARNDKAGKMATFGATRQPWSHFSRYTIDDWQTGARIGVRPCTTAVSGTKRRGTYVTAQRPISAAPGGVNGGTRLKHRVMSDDVASDEFDDMSDCMLSDDFSDDDATAMEDTTTACPDTTIRTACPERRCVVQTPDATSEISEDSASICKRDIDNEIKSLWEVGVATKKIMSTMMYLNNGLTLQPSFKRVSLAGRSRRGPAPTDQGFSKTTRRRRKQKLPPFYVKPQQRHTSANVFLTTRYTELQRTINSGRIPPESAVVDYGAQTTVTFSKLARTQILRRLQERNERKVETKRKLMESTQIQAKVDSFIRSIAKFAETKD